jgi:hypothetical protein
MFFALLTFASAFLIEALGTWVSIIGLSSLFRADPIIITLAAALDIGKVVTVSFLYKEWRIAPRTLRVYMLLATAVLMLITSAGAFGYLSAAFQGAIQDTKQQEVLIAAAIQEKAKLEARKKEIDAQIANLPPNIVRGRQRLIAAFKAEADRINARLVQLDAELPRMQVQQIALHNHTGPIVYVSQAFNVSVEQAAKYVILVIIFVFDPLAIALLVAGNFLWQRRVRAQRASSEASVQPAMPMAHHQEAAEQHADASESAMQMAPAQTPGASIPGEEGHEDRSEVLAAAGPSRPQVGRAEQEVESPEPRPARAVHGTEGGASQAQGETERVTDRPKEPAPLAGRAEEAIREAAYYIAENRKFKDGTPADDWIRAEKELKKPRSAR